MNKQIGDYIIDRIIAETNMSVLYEGKKIYNDGGNDILKCIIKQAKPQAVYVCSVDDEIRVNNEISNNNQRMICRPIFSHFEINGNRYMVMQYQQDGYFLNDLIDKLEHKYGQGNIPVKIRFQILEEILKSLKVLHSFKCTGAHKGYLHLDLHPGNIFFAGVDMEKDSFTLAQFIDFANVVPLGWDNRAVCERKLGFTLQYCAPEIVDPYCDVYGPMADLYSVGKILKRMTGKSLDNAVLNSMLEEFNMVMLNPVQSYRYPDADSALRAVERINGCIKASEDRDYYNIFCYAYNSHVDIRKINFEHMQTVIDQCKDSRLEHAVSRLADALKKDEINRNQEMYVYNCLWKLVGNRIENKEKVPISDRMVVSLINSGIACYNHMGRSSEAMRMSDIMRKKYPDSVSLDFYTDMMPRCVETYIDFLHFKKAYELISRNIEFLEAIQTYKKRLTQSIEGYQGMDCSSVALGKSYSAFGRICAFMGCNENEIMKYFDRAIEEFKMSEGNIAITYSHIMHFAIAYHNEPRYRTYMNILYPDAKSVTDALQMEVDRVHLRPYNIYVLLKGIDEFYKTEINVDITRLLHELLYDRRLDEINAHPIELIYRYLGTIIYDMHGKVYDDDCRYAMDMSIVRPAYARIKEDKPIDILQCFMYNNKWLANKMSGDNIANEELIDKLKKHCQLHSEEELQKEMTELILEELEQNRDISRILKYEHV